MFQSLQRVIIDHIGYFDDILMLKELDCVSTIHFDKLIIKKNISIEAVIDVLKILTPEAVYLEGSSASKYLSPLDIMAMQNII